ncbi:unnamed protein product [Agarophyton chilense]
MNSSQTSLSPPVRAAGPRRNTLLDTRHPPFRPNLLRYFSLNNSAPSNRTVHHNRACPQYIALLTLLLIFTCALYFAISNWRDMDSSIPRLKSAQCFLKNGIQIKKGQDISKYTVQAQVTLSNKTEALKHHTAYYGTSKPSFSLSEAKKIKTKLEGDLDDEKLPCWRTEDSTGRLISLQEITSSSSVYLAWTGTFMAAVIGVILVTVCSSSFNSGWGAASFRDVNLTPPPVAKSLHLTERQALHVCTRFEDTFCPRTAGEWTCSICLDDDQPSERIKTVVLPCHHRFHTACIKHWLWKGKGLCPLCKWDVRKFIDAEKRAAMKDGSADSDTATTTTMFSSHDAPNSQTSIMLAVEPTPVLTPPPPLPPPPPPLPLSPLLLPTPAPASAAQPRTPNVSHVTIDTDLLRDEDVRPPRRELRP